MGYMLLQEVCQVDMKAALKNVFHPVYGIRLKAIKNCWDCSEYAFGFERNLQCNIKPYPIQSIIFSGKLYCINFDAAHKALWCV